ncbi:MAG: DUF998 domain-containing protein [Gammaproteobacteria bacterium]|nr:DUF998 domain-containing protein [Gammaproteobacteria bacterium]
MTTEQKSETSLVLSYLGLRKAIGIIGISLPFVLVIGKRIMDGPGMLPSISGYYYTTMRNVFVGSLFAIGVFLLSYRGPERKDDVAGNLACLFAIGVAIFPIMPDGGTARLSLVVGYLHLAFAILLFLTLAYFSLFLFRKTDATKEMTARKRHRNAIYLTCGITILGSIILLLIYLLFLRYIVPYKLEPIFWLESFAIFAFGVSWLTKGEAILKDHETD